MPNFAFVVYPVVSVAAHWQLLWDPDSLIAAVPLLSLWGAPRQQSAAPANDTPFKKAARELREELDAAMDKMRLLLVVYGLLAIGLMAVPIYYQYGWSIADKLGRLFSVLHRRGVLEVAAYVLSLVLSIHGCSLRSDQPDYAAFVSLLGGLSSALCWAYSVGSRKLDVCQGDNDDDPSYPKTMGGQVFTCAALIPLALLHDSQAIGFFAVFAAYIAVATFIRPCLASTSGACMVTSVGIIVFFAGGLRALIVFDVTKVRGLLCFADGATLFGHVGLFASALPRSLRPSKKARKDAEDVEQRTIPPGFVEFFGCVVASMLGSLVLDAPALRSATFVFTLLWLVAQQTQLSSHGSLARWCTKALAIVVTLQYLLANWRHFVDMLNPHGLYTF